MRGQDFGTRKQSKQRKASNILENIYKKKTRINLLMKDQPSYLMIKMSTNNTEGKYYEMKTHKKHKMTTRI